MLYLRKLIIRKITPMYKWEICSPQNHISMKVNPLKLASLNRLASLFMKWSTYIMYTEQTSNNISDCNWTRTQNHLVRKWTLKLQYVYAYQHQSYQHHHIVAVENLTYRLLLSTCMLHFLRMLHIIIKIKRVFENILFKIKSNTICKINDFECTTYTVRLYESPNQFPSCCLFTGIPQKRQHDGNWWRLPFYIIPQLTILISSDNSFFSLYLE